MTMTDAPAASVGMPMSGDRDDRHGHGLRIRGAGKRYAGVPVLDGVDLDIEPGRFTVLLGPSGSGKSTLVRSIAGIERLDAGSIRLGERTVSEGARHDPPERRDLGMVFQDYALWPHLSAHQNVAYALKRRRLAGRDAATRVGEALERVGLSAKGGRYPHELSGGEQQRVALARAIVGRPRLLLFDEPLSNLDADLRERLRVEISTLTRDIGATALYITHDQSEAFALADEVGVLRAGHLEQLATPEEIYHNPATPFVARFTGLGGRLMGRILSVDAGRLAVQLGEHVIAVRQSRGLGVGDEVRVLVRPTATSMGPAGGAIAARAPIGGVSDAAMHSEPIPGIVIDVAYRGRGYEHVVESPYGMLRSVFDARSWSRGSHCTVRIDPEGCIPFPRHGRNRSSQRTVSSSTLTDR
jgi:ABC-type spermidine/putrescine transport systems, ATPase components